MPGQQFPKVNCYRSSHADSTHLNVVVPLHGDCEGRREGNVLLGHRLDVDLLQHARVAHHLIKEEDEIYMILGFLLPHIFFFGD